MTLTKDFGSLREAFNENAENGAAILRMCAAKAEQTAQTLRDLADGLELGRYEISRSE